MAKSKLIVRSASISFNLALPADKLGIFITAFGKIFKEQRSSSGFDWPVVKCQGTMMGFSDEDKVFYEVWITVNLSKKEKFDAFLLKFSKKHKLEMLE